LTGTLEANRERILIKNTLVGTLTISPSSLIGHQTQASGEAGEALKDIVLDLTQEEKRTTILDIKDWNGKIALLGTFRQGNVDSTLFQLDLGAYRQWARDRFRAEAGIAYGDTEGEATARNAYGRAKLDHFYDEDFYSYGSAEVQWDEVQNLDLRGLLGAGVGLNVWRGEGDHRALDIELGVSGIYEQYTGDSGDLKFALRAALAYLGVWGENLLFTQRLEALLPIPEANSLILRSHTALEVALADHWFLKNILEVQYLGDPPDDTKALDIKLLVGIEYKF
jgi:putative salt-induced outer membrane protein YdiY